MNVGYYFHPKAVFEPDGSARTEAHWGYFVRALAAEAGSVTFYAHAGDFTGKETLALRPQDGVRCVDVGPRRQQPTMLAMPGPSLRNFDPKGDGLDVMLVRSPTPLLPGIARRCRRAGVPLVCLVVADLATNWRPTAAFPTWRNWLIKIFVLTQAFAQRRVGRNHLMLAISRAVVSSPQYRRTAIVPTTSLSEADLTGPAARRRRFPSAGERVRLLYTGRLVEEKGLLELGEALDLLVAAGHDVEVELVGADYGDSTIDTVLERARSAGIDDRIIVAGFLEAGPELLAAYERADLYVLPTHGEGAVSRTVKEAFASGLPVVTTTIRQNLEFLQDGVHAVLVPQRSAPDLADAIARLISDPALRATISANGFEWVRDYTNERSAAIVATHLHEEVTRASGR